jgi:DNA-binding transcriptional MerR regulator
MADVSIGRLAAITGVKVATIRFYEQNRLIALPRRTEGGQRRYDADAVRQLHFIRHARELGFDVKDIRQLLALSDRPTMPCQNRDRYCAPSPPAGRDENCAIETDTLRTEAHDRGL